MAARNTIVVIFASVVSAFVSLLVLLSGVGGHNTASYLTVDTTKLSTPAKLAGSVYLKDLSKVAGNDLIGQPTTRESLGLSAHYTISLLTACGTGDDGTCSPPHFGFAFNPGSDLRLDRTAAAAAGTLTPAYFAQLRTYEAVSTFVAAALVLASFLSIVSCVAVFLVRRAAGGRAPLTAARVTTGIAAALLIGATVASIVTFVRVRDVFNAALGDVGIRTTINSSALGLTAAGAVESAIAFLLLLFMKPTGPQYPREKQENAARGVRGGSGGGGLLSRVTTWNRPRYAQIDGNNNNNNYDNKFLSNARSRNRSPESDREGLIDPAGDHDGFIHENEGYPLGNWKGKPPARDLNHVPTAYQQNASAV